MQLRQSVSWKKLTKLLEDCEKTLERLDELKCKVETEMDDNNPTKTMLD